MQAASKVPKRLISELYDRYSLYHQAAELPRELAMKASPPLLMHPHKKWFAANLKVLIVGQETLRWTLPPNNDHDLMTGSIENFWEFLQSAQAVRAMLNLYRQYKLGRSNPKLNSPFWRAFRFLSLKINGCEDTAMWTNVFKVNVNGSVIRNCNVAETAALRRSQKGLLLQEVAILRPDIVIFLSGPTYDSTIQFDFPDMKVTRLCRRLEGSTVGVIRASGLPVRTVRTFHPEYLQRSGQLRILSEISKWAVA